MRVLRQRREHVAIETKKGVPMPLRRTLRDLETLTAVALMLFLVAGPSGSMAAPTGTPTGSPAAFPVTIENCGRTLAIDAPPERIVGLDQISTELLLDLGVGANLVGTANQSDPPFPAIADEYEAIPVLAANYPTAEQIVIAEPDLIVGNLELLSFSQSAGFGGPFTRDQLDDQGIASFALICQGEVDSPELLFQRFRELGAIFGRAEHAASRVRETEAVLQGTADALKAVNAKPVPTFIYIDDEGPLQTLATPLELVGGVNIVAPDEGGCCPPAVGIAEVVDRDPAAFLITSFGNLSPEGPTVVQKQVTLQEVVPTTAGVRDERYLPIDFIAFSTLQRLEHDVKEISMFLHPELDPAYSSCPCRDDS